MKDKKLESLLPFFEEAKKLKKQGALKEPIYSRGTYQFEAAEKEKEKAFPFIQMNDEGVLTDLFCSCEKSEEGGGCPHLAASYLQIFNGQKEPLHVRFRKSFWRRLFQMASKRHGYDVNCLKQQKEGLWLSESKTQKLLFSIEATHLKTRKKLESILLNRPVETEETSIKFSNLPPEELISFREKKPSHQLQFELCFWSDLAKWLMDLEEKNKPYEIVFEGSPIPQYIQIHFPGLILRFYISEANWPWIIPSLRTVKSSLSVEEGEKVLIEKVEYNEKNKTLLIQKQEKKEKEEQIKGERIGDWIYVENQGFYRKKEPIFLEEGIVPESKISRVLTHFAKELQPFLKIHLEKRSCKYTLFFDAKQNLHIELYVLHPHDLSSLEAAAFVPWVYVPQEGFFLLEEWLFEGKERIIFKEEVAEFINKHRLWLHHYPGFQTHLGSLESHLIYHLSKEGLFFQAELNFPTEYEEVHHFDEWVYIKGEGFYMKKEARGRLPLHPGLRVDLRDISAFISSHKEELLQVQGFFSLSPVVIRNGLHLSITEEGLIQIEPEMKYREGVEKEKLTRFQDFVYEEGKGFSELPSSARLPEKYDHPTIIQEYQEASFLAYELEPLKPYILNIDPRLQTPAQLQLKIKHMLPSRKKKKKEWLLDLAYVSEIGSNDVFTIWDAMQQKKKHLFSKAGLLSLKDPRFHWIRQLSEKKLERKKGLVRVSTLDWIRLSSFESFETTEEDFKELSLLEAGREFHSDALKAKLRPYQEQGVSWLWFLYCHGLSGLLCDDMGLGKTHQAMALLASVIHEDPEKRNKYFVVCPTSVIYHWQELLKNFLPSVRVCTYYGLERSLKDFEENFDLLLTSYGILRTGKENLKPYKFEVAIFDEVQVAKNHASQTHKALRSIRSEMRLGLSGTPIENRIRELKALMDVVLPGYMPQDSTFRDVFITPIEKHQDEQKKALLSKLIRPFILRRKKSEVLTDLPEKMEEIAYCDLSEEQKELYRSIAFQMKGGIYQDLKDQTKPVSFVHVFSALSSLKRICNHPSLVLEEKEPYHAHESGKWNLFIELLNEALGSGQKVVVFSQYLEMLAIIEVYLKKKGIGFAGIKGSTKDRAAQLKKFKEDPSCEVFVASLLAAGVGIDLTVASIVIHYDRWWNPAKENQATDRVHRIGQNRGVQVFKLVTKHTIEEHIHAMIERKKGLIEDIVGGEDEITYLSRDELLQVFEKTFQEVDLL